MVRDAMLGVVRKRSEERIPGGGGGGGVLKRVD